MPLLRLARQQLLLILLVTWHLLPLALVRHAGGLIAAISLSPMTFSGAKLPLVARWDLCPIATCLFYLLLRRLPRSLMNIANTTLSSTHSHSARLSLGQ